MLARPISKKCSVSVDYPFELRIALFFPIRQDTQIIRLSDYSVSLGSRLVEQGQVATNDTYALACALGLTNGCICLQTV